MLTIERDALVFRFPEVHAEAELRIDFQRTLRVPDDNREHFLPPGLGRFPLSHVDDFAGRLPPTWMEHGGVFLPMYQAEALWLNFSRGRYPFAVKIAAGKINAVTGGAWSGELCDKPQDYLVIPEQPWLDGFCVAKGRIRQFVAMPLGQGYTAEEQLSGAAAHGGLQVLAYPMKAAWYEELKARRREMDLDRNTMSAEFCRAEMGLAPGGIMRQQIYGDRHGISAWETAAPVRCFVHILNSFQFRAVTGVAPLTQPPSSQAYTAAGLPWFDYYDADATVLAGSQKLAGLDSAAAFQIKEGHPSSLESSPVSPQNLISLGQRTRRVRDGSF
jgi:hypothetical protein